MHTFLFVLSPPFSGSTVLWQLLRTSPHVSALRAEGQHLPSVRDIMRPDRWNPDRVYPWATIRTAWEAEWDLSRPILLEKSPPHIVRAPAIEAAFDPCYFVALIREPYAFGEGYARRTGRSPAEAAEFWVMCAQHQQRNLAQLRRVHLFTYETLAESPAAVCETLTDFVPALGRLNPHGSFEAVARGGRKARPLRNMNAEKIDRLPARALAEMTAVLTDHEPLLHAFGYALRRPTPGHQARHWRRRLVDTLGRKE